MHWWYQYIENPDSRKFSLEIFKNTLIPAWLRGIHEAPSISYRHGRIGDSPLGPWGKRANCSITLGHWSLLPASFPPGPSTIEFREGRLIRTRFELFARSCPFFAHILQLVLPPLASRPKLHNQVRCDPPVWPPERAIVFICESAMSKHITEVPFVRTCMNGDSPLPICIALLAHADMRASI